MSYVPEYGYTDVMRADGAGRLLVVCGVLLGMLTGGGELSFLGESAQRGDDSGGRAHVDL
jgi:hypothetical protein